MRSETGGGGGGYDCDAVRQLHALEQQRARELHAHGEAARQLQTQLDSHRRNEKELQAAVAKLRADKCRLEAETNAAAAKWRVLQEDAAKRDQQHERAVEDFRQRLFTKEEEISGLKRTIERVSVDKTEAVLVHTDTKARMEAMVCDISRLTEERDHARSQLSASNEELSRLASRLAVKHAELEAERVRAEGLVAQFDRAKVELLERSSDIQQLTKACERLEITRLRLAAWRQAQVDLQKRRNFSRDLFLAWRAETLVLKALRLKNTEAETIYQKEKLLATSRKLNGELQASRNMLSQAKSWLASQQKDLCAWKELFEATFTSKVLSRLELERMRINERCDAQVATLLEQREDTRVKHKAELSTIQLAADKREEALATQVEGLLCRIDTLHDQKLRSLAFQGWKDVYLRNVVAETTHAVMVARTAQALVSGRVSNRMSHVGGGSITERENSFRPTPLSPRKKNATACLRAPHLTIDPSMRQAEEDQWKRWRRITPTDRRSSATSSIPISKPFQSEKLLQPKLVEKRTSELVAEASSARRQASIT